MKLVINRILAMVCLSVLLFPLSLSAQSSGEILGLRNDLKVTLLSLGSGSTRITYERAFSRKNSAELTLGLIGIGWDWINHTRSRGVLVKAAYKWRLIPQGSSHSWLAGFYVKPELVYAQFLYGPQQNWGGVRTKAREDMSSIRPEETRQFALLAECGYQLLLNWFVFDVYCGLGPSFGTGNSNNYYHSFMLYPSDGRLAFTAGFRVGFAF
ncbi:MAG: hypothetical protein J6031_04120 [Bacteroidales bacterium]|nr:hypothetical protein [Bacteroidales bacterium]